MDDGGWETVKSKSDVRSEKEGRREASAEEARRQKRAAQAALILRVKEYVARIERETIRSLQGNVEDNAERTLCLMFFPGRGGEPFVVVRNTSGSSYGIKGELAALRDTCGVDTKKQTVCAEERLLAEHPAPQTALFSVTFDSMGRKDACPNCRRILESYDIQEVPRS